MKNFKKEKKIQEKFIFGGTHPFFLHPFLSSFTPGLVQKTVLDVGCGKGINGYLIRVTRDTKGGNIIGLDLNENYLDFCRSLNIYDKLVRANLPKLPFPDKTIDFLICTEVIEHLSEKEGKILLKEIDRVCRGRVIISTPNVFFATLPTGKGDEHRSLWKVSDFKKNNYQVFGLGIKTPLLVSDPLLRVKQALYYLFTPLSYFIPEISGMLLCVKNYT